MKRILLLCLLPLCLNLQAQIQRGLKGSYNTEKFPEISFVWNSANSEVLQRSQFILTENDKDINFRLAVLQKNNILQKKKSILFLWEDMASHKGQLGFSRKLLTRFFDETGLNREDRFNIAVFNRVKDSGKNALQLLLPDFVDNGKELGNAVKNYQNSNEYFKEFPLQSDLYLAINNGVDLLKKQPAGNIGIIVTVTAGLNIKAAGASTEMETVRKNALDAGIPVYVIKYPVFGDTPEINILAESTHGLSFTSGNAETTLNELQRFYRDFNIRSDGQDYEITFTTTAKRDGKSHHIRMTIDRAPQQIPSFTAPDMTVGLWIKENVWLFVALAAAFIGLALLAVWFIRKKIAEKDRKIAENEAKLQGEISASGQALEEMKKQQEAKEQQQQAEAARKAHEEEEERLARLMQTKNLFPRLQCRAGNSSFTFNINKPLTTIGRKGFNNDVELDSEKVSRYHAEIVFTGGGFEIIDKGSTNKVIVNGQFVQRATLKNSDIIGLGEAVIIFYV